MTYALVRAGLPNVMVALALAAVPVVALAMTAGESMRDADVQTRFQAPMPAITADGDATAGGYRALAD